jgi:hypothetical protein
LHKVTDLAQITFDLVHYGGFSYESVMRMPPFEREYHHVATIDAMKREREFQMAIHGAKEK